MHIEIFYVYSIIRRNVVSIYLNCINTYINIIHNIQLLYNNRIKFNKSHTQRHFSDKTSSHRSKSISFSSTIKML